MHTYTQHVCGRTVVVLAHAPLASLDLAIVGVSVGPVCDPVVLRWAGMMGGGYGYQQQSGQQQLPPNFKEGDWMCPKCNAHNFRDKDQCFKCGTDRPAGSGGKYR